MNPKHHPDYPYDPNNPYRTETQRLKSLSYTPKSMWTQMREFIASRLLDHYRSK